MRTARFSGGGGQTPPRYRPPPHCEQTDKCKNIALLQTSFVGGKDGPFIVCLIDSDVLIYPGW